MRIKACLIGTAMLAVAGCNHGSSTDAAASASPSASPSPAPVTAIAVAETPLPGIGLTNFKTAGTYPLLVGTSAEVVAVNAKISAAIGAEQSAFRTSYLKVYGGKLNHDPTPGTYFHDSDASEAVANTGLFSTMYPTTRLYPGGNDGDGWFSLTLKGPSAEPVALGDLFTDGLVGIAAKVEAETKRTQGCGVGGSPDPIAEAGYEPTAANYSHFALTPDGIDVGLSQGQIGAEACDTVHVSIPWSALAAGLSDEGRQLHALAVVPGLQVPCSPPRIFAAAMAKEHFTANDPGFKELNAIGNGPAATFVHCHEGWALADISRPGVGTTDGLTLFRTVGDTWTEVANLGYERATCAFEKQGMPAATAKLFLPFGPEHGPDSGC